MRTRVASVSAALLLFFALNVGTGYAKAINNQNPDNTDVLCYQENRGGENCACNVDRPFNANPDTVNLVNLDMENRNSIDDDGININPNPIDNQDGNQFCDRDGNQLRDRDKDGNGDLSDSLNVPSDSRT